MVGTRVGGIPDIIASGVNGLLVPSGDAAALAAAIVELVDDPDGRRQMGIAGQRTVRERYSADRMVKELKDLYRNLLDRTTLKRGPA